MQTLPYVRKAVAPYVEDSGVCEDDPRVLEAINEARRLLYPLGDWKNITAPFCIRPYCGVITLPWEYEYAKTAYLCCRQVVVENDWFAHLPGDFDYWCGNSLGRIVRSSGEFAGFRDWPNEELRSKCEVCAPFEGFLIEVILEDDRDIGTKITFQGIGRTRAKVSLTRTLTEKSYHSNIPQPGEERMIHLQRVIKPKTFGRLRIYGRDGANKILMAVYDPDEINPQYARYHVGGFYRTGVVVKAKLRFVPYEERDDQFIDINTDALIHVLQALKSRKNSNLAEYSGNISLAIALLNRELGGEQSTSTGRVHFSRAYHVTGLIE